MSEGTQIFSAEELYTLYKRHGGSVAAILNDRDCRVKSRQTFYRYIKTYKLKERYEKELAEIEQVRHKRVIMDIEGLTKLKDGLIAKVMTMANNADPNDPRNIYALKAAWEIVRTELNLPTTISQNANLNIEAYANKRTVEEIDRDIADFLITAAEASPQPPTGS